MMKLSARNQIKGKVTAVTKGHTTGHVHRDIGGGVPDPAAVAADVGGELHVGNDCQLLAFAIFVYPIIHNLL